MSVTAFICEVTGRPGQITNFLGGYQVCLSTDIFNLIDTFLKKSKQWFDYLEANREIDFVEKTKDPSYMRNKQDYIDLAQRRHIAVETVGDFMKGAIAKLKIEHRESKFLHLRDCSGYYPMEQLQDDEKELYMAWDKKAKTSASVNETSS